MKKTRLVLLLVLCALASACTAKGGPVAPPPFAVKIVELRRATVMTSETLDGQVTPYLQASIATQQPGTVLHVYANEGDSVRAGQILAKIDDAPLRAQLAEQEGSQVQARSRLAQSLVQLPITNQQYASGLTEAERSLAIAREQEVTDREAVANTRLTFEANERLLAQGYVPATTTEQSRADYVAAQQALTADHEKISSATAALEQAKRNLLNTPLQRHVVEENRGSVQQSSGTIELLNTQIDETTLRAPFDGIVTQRLLDPGAYASPSQAIYQVSQLDPTYVDFNLRDADLAYVRAGTAVWFSTSALPGRRYRARVTQINAVPTNGTLLYRARITMRNPDLALRGGMLVSVTIQRQVHRNTFVVPLSAVTQTENGAMIFIAVRAVGATGKPILRAKQLRVDTGLQTAKLVEVRGKALHAGLRVIAARPDALQDGQPIRPGGR